MGTKKLVALIFTLIICAFMRKEVVLAGDTEGNLMVVDIETLDEGWDAALEYSGYVEIVDEDVPYAVLPFEEQSENSYDVVDFTTEAYVIWYKYDYVVATVWATGKAYFYEDGKVHLYSIQVHVNHIDGATYVIRDYDLTNTDGSMSGGGAYVDITYKSETLTGAMVVVLTGGSRDIVSKWLIE